MDILPAIFLAYPSESAVADSMRRLADELKPTASSVVTWEDLRQPGLLFDPIATAIDNASLVLAETTSGNANVLFELGYAIARKKAVFQLEDQTVATPRRLPPLDIVRQIQYVQRKQILDYLQEPDLTGPTLSDRLGVDSVARQSGGLYFIPSRAGGDVNEAILKVCREGPFKPRTVDLRDTEYDSLHSQTRSISEADLFVTFLVRESARDAWDINAQLMLFAGFAVGLGKEVAVLAQQPLRRLLDLGDRGISFTSESEAEFRLAHWLRRIASAKLQSPAPPRSVRARPRSPMTGLFLGSLDARADFELGAYFVETPEFHQAEAGKRHLFVGSKGTGKTANFETLREVFENRNCVVVSIAPADFEFPRLAAVFDTHLSLAHWEFVYGSFWRFIFLSEILRVIKSEYLDHLLRESSKRYAAELLAWFRENDELLSKDFTSRVTAVLSDISQVEGDQETKRARLEEILQAARMYEIENHLTQFAQQFEIRFLIDDLDRNWSPANPSANRLVIALLNEIQDLMTRLAPRLQPAVFIRRDVFAWLEENDPEILKRDPAVLQWSPESLELLVARRLAAHLDTGETEPSQLWSQVLPEHTRGERTQDFIVNRTLLRPRDVIQFCQRAIELAQRAGRQRVSEDDVYGAWAPTGELMLAQVETEYGHRYPGLGSAALAFLEGPVRQQWTAVAPKIRDLATASASPLPAWIQEGLANPQRLLEVLYETGILAIETPGGNLWFESERRFSDLLPVLPADFPVVVHPAFQRYLHCSGV